MAGPARQRVGGRDRVAPGELAVRRPRQRDRVAAVGRVVEDRHGLRELGRVGHRPDDLPGPGGRVGHAAPGGPARGRRGAAGPGRRRGAGGRPRPAPRRSRPRRRRGRRTAAATSGRRAAVRRRVRGRRTSRARPPHPGGGRGRRGRSRPRRPGPGPARAGPPGGRRRPARRGRATVSRWPGQDVSEPGTWNGLHTPPVPSSVAHTPPARSARAAKASTPVASLVAGAVPRTPASTQGTWAARVTSSTSAERRDRATSSPAAVTSTSAAPPVGVSEPSPGPRDDGEPGTSLPRQHPPHGGQQPPEGGVPGQQRPLAQGQPLDDVRVPDGGHRRHAPGRGRDVGQHGRQQAVRTPPRQQQHAGHRDAEDHGAVERRS